MIVSGLLSTMNVWADSSDDINFSLNDLYMSVLMAGWMIFFMALVYGDKWAPFVGLLIVVAAYMAIRYQLFISETQFLQGMIPHHSMAVFMSKRLMERPNGVGELLTTIVGTQKTEIAYMKGRLKALEPR
jgi:hypothetical protein